jgi:hypothetical protein
VQVYSFFDDILGLSSALFKHLTQVEARRELRKPHHWGIQRHHILNSSFLLGLEVRQSVLERGFGTVITLVETSLRPMNYLKILIMEC